MADLPWLVETLAEANQDPTLPRSRARAVDGTDWETCGRWLGTKGVEYDGETPPDTDADPEEHRKAVERARRRARRASFETGADGRPIHTRDVDARAGHRSATSEHKAGTYIGYELHPFTQVRDIVWQGKPGELQIGPDVPAYVTNASLTPAGAHRTDAVVPALIAERTTIDGVECGLRDVTWDRGYSINADARTHAPLRLHGIEPVTDLAPSSAPSSRSRRTASGSTFTCSRRIHRSTCARSRAPSATTRARSAPRSRRSTTSGHAGGTPSTADSTPTATCACAAPSARASSRLDSCGRLAAHPRARRSSRCPKV
ncbi:hypothetical protein Q6348_13910 [Isoptericola sp. b441]|uniref:Transposase n=1 Tax=Actinotalea lenta TaxID=3064654 RepID=A0ABT9DCQ7_9CELL|nr:hypothetical protein [Isoptericola sp. b441]MDO8108291.1 hypothetical protein [Isoptericola sp. b441]